MGFTCKVVRGFLAFAPCLEHVRAGGGGVVSQMPLLIDHDGVGYYSLHWVVPNLYSVTLLTSKLPWSHVHGPMC